ncbi:hypothetical protein HN681_03645 [archaeon]|jgi:hypothetical protein|nr:hypothetical protein [archaeon]MBT3731115.1 hypothetical protein [archaeon]MBT4670228.1 hypothetical protein [archaeon]MBT5030482.1 hypothetical protein [archaeon]MBT5287835.1 hypothetical protein [archaeon]
MKNYARILLGDDNVPKDLYGLAERYNAVLREVDFFKLPAVELSFRNGLMSEELFLGECREIEDLGLVTLLV